MPSKRETVLQYLVETLLPTITVANGYSQTISLVDRGVRPFDRMNDPDFPCLLLADTKETRKNITANQFMAHLAVTLIGGIKSADGVSQNQKYLDRLVADVTKCLETDRLQGGRVIRTTVAEIETDSGEIDPHAAAVFTIEMDYTTEGTNP
jgi:hypothetical protein